MNRLTEADRQRGLQNCAKLKLEILRHQYKKAHSPRQIALIEARAKSVKRSAQEFGGVCS